MAKFLTAKGVIKTHTCCDDTLMIPDVINISEAKVHDRYGLAQLIFPKNSIFVEDREYFDFQLMLNRIHANKVFITRIKDNTIYESVEVQVLPQDDDQYILKDEIIQLSG